MRLGRVPGVAGPTSPNNAGRGAHDEPGPSASVLRMSAFRPSADLRGRAPGRREEPGPGTRARKRTQSWDRPRAAQGRNAVRSHAQVLERAFPLGRDAVLRRPSRGHREHPPPGAPPARRPQGPQDSQTVGRDGDGLGFAPRHKAIDMQGQKPRASAHRGAGRGRHGEARGRGRQRDMLSWKKSTTLREETRRPSPEGRLSVLGDGSRSPRRSEQERLWKGVGLADRVRDPGPILLPFASSTASERPLRATPCKKTVYPRFHGSRVNKDPKATDFGCVWTGERWEQAKSC